MMSKQPHKYTWSPWSTLMQQGHSGNYGVVILNRPVNFRPHSSEMILEIWNKANLRITVDGGTDRWLAWLKANNLMNRASHPDLITGDLDSISTQSLQFYKSQVKTRVIFTEDQNETDFTKALREAHNYCGNNKLELERIFVFCETSGRFDQLISNINSLFKMKNIMPDCELYIISRESMIWLLVEGEHKIEIPTRVLENREWCGLLPIGAPCQVTSAGLKWDLNKSILEFGGMVSSSNTYNGDDVVTIETDSPIVWSMGVKTLFDVIT